MFKTDISLFIKYVNKSLNFILSKVASSVLFKLWLAIFFYVRILWMIVQGTKHEKFVNFKGDIHLISNKSTYRL